MTAGKLVAAILAWACAGRAVALEQSWFLATQFVDGSGYAIRTTSTIAGERAGLSVALQSTYVADPTETTGLTYWSRNPANMERLCYAVSGHAVAVVGDWIYVLGGCQKVTGSGCGGPGGPSNTVATVWIHHIEPNGDLTPTGFLCPNTNWRQADFELGAFQTGVGKGIPMRYPRVAVVGRRIYLVGGATANCGTAPFPGSQLSIDTVYSTEVNLTTGEPGPWRPEMALPSPASQHGLVYAGGALYCLGGLGTGGTSAQLQVVKAEINPADGRLYSDGGLFWDPALSLPTGSVPLTTPPCAVPTGWVWISPFTFMRSIGFVGGAYTNFPFGSCEVFRGSYHGVLDDCNRVQEWMLRSATGGLFASGVLAYNGTLLQAGGGSPGGSSSANVWHNLTDPGGTGTPGIVREGAGDLDELRPGDPDGNELLTKASPYTLAQPMKNITMARYKEWAYIVGGDMGGSPDACYYAYRAWLPSTTYWVDAGHYVSPPYDMQGTFQLSRVAWSFTKSGTSANDDWVSVRYRVADPSGKWTCWSPRIPESASMPVSPGYYTYASDAASVLFREPLMRDIFQYIQFEVSLYNDKQLDGTVPTLPVFDEFRISYGPVSLPKPVSCPLEVYPNPAKSTVTIRFEVAADGGEVTARVYNAAARLAAQESFKYLQGGVKEETFAVSEYAPGAYVVVLEGLARGGGAGLTCKKTGEVLKTAKAKFVVRR